MRRPTTTPLRHGPSSRKAEAESVERSVYDVMKEFERQSTRARAMVRRLIQAGGLDHMLTLTYRENQVDAAQCDADLTRFLRLVRDVIPAFRYVAVFERQKRGAGHWHLAVAGWQPVRVLRALWLRVVGTGNIDVRSWAKGGRPGECSARLASYLSKYITKSLSEREELPHRYRRSHNIVVVERIEVHEESDLDTVLQKVFARLPGREPRFIFRADAAGRSFIWACSWGNRGECKTESKWQGSGSPPSGAAP